MKDRRLKILLSTLSLWLFGFGLYAQTAALSGFTDEAGLKAANALKDYIELEDNAYNWELRESFQVGKATVHHLLLTSQQWKGYPWRHQLTLFVPEKVDHGMALLFISGGSNEDGQPKWSKPDRMLSAMADLANHNKAMVTLLKQIPNQPLFDGKTEDELISFTLHKFINEGDYTWPLLFPMVKGAIKAMDAIQEFSRQNLEQNIDGFLVSGASKRGWTTWLTAATGDPRVKAIAPMVIDVLNMPVNLKYQIDSYGEYSEQLQDYVDLGIVQGMGTEAGNMLVTMIDPYAYRNKIKVPKMVFIGTNDEYWTVDAIKHYWDGIPGDNLIHYVPNVGHNLGGGKHALEGLSAFFALTLLDIPYPVSVWDMHAGKDSASLTLDLEDPSFLDVFLWAATSEDRDFRDEKWKPQKLEIANGPTIKINTAYPQEGYKAFYLDLKYSNPNGGSYTVSTRVFLTDRKEVL